MIDELNHVCAHTPPTAAQRRAGLIADATVLANKTFGRDAIAALQGTWVADDFYAELEFSVNGEQYVLMVDATPEATYWIVGHPASMTEAPFTVVTTTTPRDAAARLKAALATVQADVARAMMPHMDAVFDAIRAERERQHAKWGTQDHDPYTWLAVLGEEYGELSQAILHDTFGGKAAGTMRDELLHVVAVGCQWLECLERQAAGEEAA